MEVPAQDKKERCDNERGRKVPPGGTIRRTRAGRSWMVSEDEEADGPRSLCSIQKHLCSSDRRAICIAAISKRQPAKQHVCFEKLLPVMQ